MDQNPKLRLLLGLGRSGTTWLSSIIGNTNTPMRFVMEGIGAYRPKIKLAKARDYTAIAFKKSLNAEHPLVQFYEQMRDPEFNIALHNMQESIVRNDEGYQNVLVKEVHSIFATEALLNQLECKAILLVRDPARIIDSLFTRDGLNSYYLDRESEEFFGSGIVPKHKPWQLWKKVTPNSELLNHYFADKIDAIAQIGQSLRETKHRREKIVQTKLITAGLMTQMLTEVSKVTENSLYMNYEEIVAHTLTEVQRALNHLELPFDNGISDFISQSASRTTTNNDAFPVFRTQSAVAVADKPFKFLTNNEVQQARNVLSDIGVETDFSASINPISKAA